jgi:hypothetical protein
MRDIGTLSRSGRPPSRIKTKITQLAGGEWPTFAEPPTIELHR